MVASPAQCWTALDPAWRACFLLAWESFRLGSVPVGAVLVDPAGAIVASGRNRRNEATGPGGQVAGSSIAHAEVNALAALAPGDYRDHVLYTTLEPCLLCTAALRYSHVGTVRFAAEDPVWYGVDRIPELNHHLARRWARREGPLSGPLRAWAALLPLLDAVDRGVRSVLDSHRDAMPEVLALAQRLAGPAAERLRGVTLDEGIAALWADLPVEPAAGQVRPAGRAPDRGQIV